MRAKGVSLRKPRGDEGQIRPSADPHDDIAWRKRVPMPNDQHAMTG
jgi:hypothetical protein